MRLFELDNGTMSQARLAREVWDYERYAGHRVWEGARGTNGRTSRSGSATGTPAPRPSHGCMSSWRASRSTCSTTAARRSPPRSRASPSRCG
ncbi:replication-relaxation family protein [Streptomyces europaeiscabiei]|uniref:replication-relaxation family protein n=1 Tax=Streptomyces europaeiscabiei TaxID=146819 RepID=UPI0029AC4D91|nr:replication-relaxation family protein [Streptomyces europaeiscabiei]MDX2769797.1 replication-relaxation family protein [Streptomyces europaeiscabiei]